MIPQTNRFTLWPQFQSQNTVDPAQERYRFIRSEMMLAGITNEMIADKEQVTPIYVTYVITERRKGYRIRRAIAAACNKAVADLWPDTPPEHREAA